MIEFSQVHKTYRNGTEALRGIDVVVRKGRMFALLGPNGAGKSSALRILTTLSAPTSGQVSVAGQNVAIAPRQVRRAVGYVPQRAALDELLTGRQTLNQQGRLNRLTAADIRARTERLIAELDLQACIDARVSTLSGGFVRRLQIATALMHDPPVLVLDEPTVGLDPDVRAHLWTMLQGAARNQGKTILFSTHYLEEAENFADEVAIIDSGRIVAEGPPGALTREIHGDVVSLEVDGEVNEDLLNAVRACGSKIIELSATGSQVHVGVLDGPASIARIVSSVQGTGASVRRASVTVPSLGDVYAGKTGRSYDVGRPAEKLHRKSWGTMKSER